MTSTIIERPPTGGKFSKYIIPDGVRIICNDAFHGCSELEDVHIPSSVNFIGAGAFSGCSKLRSIQLPDSVVYIGNGAFCGVLSKITIPASVKMIDGNPFDCNCKIVSKSCKYIVVDDVLYSSDMKRLLSYCNQQDSFSIPLGVKVVGKEAFRDSDLKTIIFPNTVEEIECYAFEGNGFSMLKLPTSLKKINKHAFSRCEIGCLDVSSIIDFFDEKDEVLNCLFDEIECNLLKVPKRSINYFKKITSDSEIIAIIDEDYIFENDLFFNADKTEIISSFIPSFVSETDKDYYIPEGTILVRDDALFGVCRGERIHLPESLKHISKNAFGASTENFDGDLFVPKGTIEKYNSIFPDLHDQIFEES